MGPDAPDACASASRGPVELEVERPHVVASLRINESLDSDHVLKGVLAAARNGSMTLLGDAGGVELLQRLQVNVVRGRLGQRPGEVALVRGAGRPPPRPAAVAAPRSSGVPES